MRPDYKEACLPFGAGHDQQAGSTRISLVIRPGSTSRGSLFSLPQTDAAKARKLDRQLQRIDAERQTKKMELNALSPA